MNTEGLNAPKINIDQNLKVFLRPFLTGKFEEFQQGRNKFINLNEEGSLQVHYLKTLWIFLGAACHSADTFMSMFFLWPEVIKESYVPFV